MCEKLYRRWKRNGTTKPRRRRSAEEISVLRIDGIVGIRLTRGLIAWIDEADLYLVSGRIWRAVRRGYAWYAVADIDGKPVYMHDLLMKPSKGFEVDHLNGNGLWNFRWNLRNVSHQVNMLNSRRCIGGDCLQKLLEHDALDLSEKQAAALQMS